MVAEMCQNSIKYLSPAARSKSTNHLPTLKRQFLQKGILTVAETVQKDSLLSKDSSHERGFEMGNNYNFNFFSKTGNTPFGDVTCNIKSRHVPNYSWFFT